jgi:hypothetical protein
MTSSETTREMGIRVFSRTKYRKNEYNPSSQTPSFFPSSR